MEVQAKGKRALVIALCVAAVAMVHGENSKSAKDFSKSDWWSFQSIIRPVVPMPDAVKFEIDDIHFQAAPTNS